MCVVCVCAGFQAGGGAQGSVWQPLRRRLVHCAGGRRKHFLFGHPTAFYLAARVYYDVLQWHASFSSSSIAILCFFACMENNYVFFSSNICYSLGLNHFGGVYVMRYGM